MIDLAAMLEAETLVVGADARVVAHAVEPHELASGRDGLRVDPVVVATYAVASSRIAPATRTSSRLAGRTFIAKAHSQTAHRATKGRRPTHAKRRWTEAELTGRDARQRATARATLRSRPVPVRGRAR